MKYYIIYDDGSKEESTIKVCQQLINNDNWVYRKVENDIYVFSK